MSDDNNTHGLGSAALLKLLLEKANAPGPAPEGTAQRVAEDYAKSKGMKLSEPDLEVKAKPHVSSKIAEAYSQMQHNPNDPKVAKAYQALIKETEDQFEALQKAGLKISKITPDMQNPYKNSQALVEDITKNKHMFYFPTEQGFGSGGDFSNHPLFKESRLTGPDGKPMKANDLFRVVHDYFGHAKDGNKFGATGEERAYLEHSKMYSPEARKALASETRGQNSWVNYGPIGEVNRANPAATTYADQKAGLLPDWATKHIDEIDSPIKYRAKALAKIAGKAVAPTLGIGAALLAPSADAAAAELLVPGGADSVGMSPQDERQMLTEIDAQKNYQNSPAHEDFEKNQGIRQRVLRSLAGK
jgi:hypothetical protein